MALQLTSSSTSSAASSSNPLPPLIQKDQQGLILLSEEQIQTFLHDGVLVVDDVLSEEEIDHAKIGLNRTLLQQGVDVSILLQQDDSSSTEDHCQQQQQEQQKEPILKQAKAFTRLSSTNGSGGVLDLFYDDWKLNVATNPTLFAMTTQLWKAAYGGGGCQDDNETIDSPKEEEKDEDDRISRSAVSHQFNEMTEFQWHHPYGSFDYHRGYLYMDRIGFRLPTKTCESLGQILYHSQQQQREQGQHKETGHNNNNKNSKTMITKTMTKKKKKALALQRSLTPHLDCCPDTLFQDTANKWRPIQCMISLTDNLEPNTGGFEAAKGFHRTFSEWARTRPQPPTSASSPSTSSQPSSLPSLCVGEYTHIRPKEDREVLERISHVPVKAGSAVFWDNRIPHANAYRHEGLIPRAVVYCSFLPDIPLNRQYVQHQLRDYQTRRPPMGSDQWRRDDDVKDGENGDEQPLPDYRFTALGRKLMGLDPW